MTTGTTVERVDAVVVGSGFGGSVTAYRLAEAGHATVLLERGRPYPPGSFARNPYEMSRAFWEPKDELFGLFDVRSFRKLEAIVSSGLGGGSLIYANVLLRKDEEWFVRDSPIPGGGYEHWPVSRADLDPHYDAVERMLHPVPSPYPDLPKTAALRDAARALDLEVIHPPLAVSFSRTRDGEPEQRKVIEPPEYGNLHGATRLTCRLCGECDIGCNDGSKNTLDHTYLSASVHHGADIRSHCEVTAIRPLDGGGYAVTYTEYGDTDGDDGRRPRTARTVQCDRLFLAAGALGTTALLLRNRVNLPGLSRALGTRFSGNGDLLTFALGARTATGADGPRLIDGSHGPVITTSVRVPDETDGAPAGQRGYYIQEAGFPEFANWLIETAQVTRSARRAATLAREIMRHRLRGRNESTISAEVAGLVGQGRLGASSIPLLGMGRDVPDGRVVLRDGEIDVDWSIETSKRYFAAVRETMRAMSGQLRAEFHDNPLWWTRRVVTVHPVGGAPMGRSPQDGLVDGRGEVFGHPGLYVVDGAAMPGPVGPNPALTIAANADRIVEAIIDAPSAGRRTVAARPTAADAPGAPLDGDSVEFTEQMKGFMALGETDPVTGWERAKLINHRFMFKLTITVPDIDRFLADNQHEGTAEGFVRCEVLGGELPVERGWFNLFVANGEADTREMRYRLWFRDLAGAPVTMYGYKTVRDDPGLDIWRDTSTLHITLMAGHVPPGGDGEVLGAGVLRILPRDFARQLTTFRADGASPLSSLGRFGTHFTKALVDTYAPIPRESR